MSKMLPAMGTGDLHDHLGAVQIEIVAEAVAIIPHIALVESHVRWRNPEIRRKIPPSHHTLETRVGRVNMLEFRITAICISK